MRSIKYSQALSEGIVQAMERDPDIFLTGIAVDYPSGIFGSTVEATRRFGPGRVFDAPAMENALTVLMPAFPRDAKGLMMSALRHPGPVVMLEYRTLYDTVGEVPEEPFEVPIGKAAVVKEGRDITIVGTSFMSYEAVHAAEELAKNDISAEVID